MSVHGRGLTEAQVSERLPPGWVYELNTVESEEYWEAHPPGYEQTGMLVQARDPVELIARAWALWQTINIAADAVSKTPPQLPIGGIDWEHRAGLVWMGLYVPPPASRQPPSIFVGSEGETRPFYDNATSSPGEAYLCRVVAGPVDSLVAARALPTTPPPPAEPEVHLVPAFVTKPAAQKPIPAPLAPTELGPPTGPMPTLIELARQKGYTGNPCSSCGGWSMVRNGSCEKCVDCGSTNGCS